MRLLYKFKFVLIGIFFLVNVNLAWSGQTKIWLDIDKVDNKLLVGEIVKFSIFVDVLNNLCTGAQGFITFDPEIFKPVYVNGKPFVQGSFITNSAPILNNTHDDEWFEPYVDLNGISGFQLDYSQITPPAGVPGGRLTVTGSGVLAYFYLEVIRIPDNENQTTTISFNNVNLDSRQTGWFELLDGSSGRTNFGTMTNLEVAISGVGIFPELEDRIISPGDNISIFLGDHYLGAEFDSSQAIWTSKTHNLPANSIFAIDTVNNADLLSYITAVNAHGELQTSIYLTVPGNTYEDSTTFNVIVDHPPVFRNPLPQITINEDIDSTILSSVIFTDADDSGLNLNVSISETENIYILYNGDNTMTLSSNENWFGTEDVKLKITDILGLETEDIITINVDPVNDLPVLDFTGIENAHYLDTLIIHHSVNDTIDLNTYFFDIEDANAQNWSYENTNTSVLSVSNLNISTYLFNTVQSGYYGNIPVYFEAEDSDGAKAKDTLIVSIRSFPPQPILNDIKMLAQENETINLLSFVDDPDTHIDSLHWAFEVYDPETMQLDSAIVHLDYNFNTQKLDIISDSSWTKMDLLAYTVTDDDNNTVWDTVGLYMFETYNPVITEIEPQIIYEDTLRRLFYLNDLVMDVNTLSKDIIWDIRNFNQNLLDLYIEKTENDSQFLVIQTYEGIFGLDSVNLTATNLLTPTPLSTSISIDMYIVPRDPYPLILDIPADSLFWQDSLAYMDLDDIVWDALSITDTSWMDSLVWIVQNTNGLINTYIDSNHVLTFVTYKSLGQDSIDFTVRNTEGYISRKRVGFKVIEDDAPYWLEFPDMYMTPADTTLSLKISEFVSDDLTDDSLLVIQWEDIENISKLDFTLDSLNDSLHIHLNDVSFLDTIKFYLIATDEFNHSKYSNPISLEVLVGYKPEWAEIPEISFPNDTVYAGLVLGDYVEDQDTPDKDLSYEVDNIQNLVEIEIDTNAIMHIIPEESFAGKTWIILHAIDPQGSTASVVVNILVYDRIPPQAIIRPFYDTVIDNRVDFVVSGDKTIIDFTTSFFKNNVPEILNFQLLDNYENIWKASYKFKTTGYYRLLAQIRDENDNNTFIELLVTATVAKIGKNMVYNADGDLSFEYSGSNKEHYIYLMEYMPSNLSRSLAKSSGSIAYSLDSPVHQDEFALITKKNMDNSSLYYAFYTLDENNYEQELKTYRNRLGEFQALTPLNQRVLFKSSETKAADFDIPIMELKCYPNPFNSMIQVEWSDFRSQFGKIVIYNILGQQIFKSDSRLWEAGSHQIVWNGKSIQGVNVPSGIYFVRFEGKAQNTLLKKITLLK